MPALAVHEFRRQKNLFQKLIPSSYFAGFVLSSGVYLACRCWSALPAPLLPPAPGCRPVSGQPARILASENHFFSIPDLEGCGSRSVELLDPIRIRLPNSGSGYGSSFLMRKTGKHSNFLTAFKKIKADLMYIFLQSAAL